MEKKVCGTCASKQSYHGVVIGCASFVHDGNDGCSNWRNTMCEDSSCGSCDRCRRLAREAYGESDPYVFYWPDGVWCWPEDLEEHVTAPCAKSDDFAVLEVGHLDGDEEVEVKVTEKVNNMHK